MNNSVFFYLEVSLNQFKALSNFSFWYKDSRFLEPPFVSFQITFALTLQTGFAYLKTFLNQWIFILILHHKLEYTRRGYTNLNDFILVCNL